MARVQKLKVYRTPIGFHDAYVAAPSQKAALEAWGTDANLFARGSAELVSDAELVREPLANPGKVIRRSRGSIDEQLAALPPEVVRQKPSESGDRTSALKPSSQHVGARVVPARPRPKPTPKPSRVKLDHAEQRLADLLSLQETQMEELREREKAIRQERRDLEERQDRDRRKAETLARSEQEAHAGALRRWREAQ